MKAQMDGGRNIGWLGQTHPSGGGAAMQRTVQRRRGARMSLVQAEVEHNVNGDRTQQQQQQQEQPQVRAHLPAKQDNEWKNHNNNHRHHHHDVLEAMAGKLVSELARATTTTTNHDRERALLQLQSTVRAAKDYLHYVDSVAAKEVSLELWNRLAQFSTTAEESTPTCSSLETLERTARAARDYLAYVRVAAAQEVAGELQAQLARWASPPPPPPTTLEEASSSNNSGSGDSPPTMEEHQVQLPSVSPRDQQQKQQQQSKESLVDFVNGGLNGLAEHEEEKEQEEFSELPEKVNGDMTLENQQEEIAAFPATMNGDMTLENQKEELSLLPDKEVNGGMAVEMDLSPNGENAGDFPVEMSAPTDVVEHEREKEEQTGVAPFVGEDASATLDSVVADTDSVPSQDKQNILQVQDSTTEIEPRNNVEDGMVDTGEEKNTAAATVPTSETSRSDGTFASANELPSEAMTEPVVETQRPRRTMTPDNLHVLVPNSFQHREQQLKRRQLASSPADVF